MSSPWIDSNFLIVNITIGRAQDGPAPISRATLGWRDGDDMTPQIWDAPADHATLDWDSLSEVRSTIGLASTWTTSGNTTVLVIPNAASTVAALNARSQHCGLTPLVDLAPVLDPLLVAANLEPHLPVATRIEDLCERYGVPLSNPTDEAIGVVQAIWDISQQSDDAIMARYPDARYPYELACRWSSIATLDAHDLHTAQGYWMEHSGMAPHSERWPCGIWPAP